ncbi:hypothetical protein H4S08_000531 [Coemansia sp. RSA 1365]|nr:hypothetical protein H4S08_000531 [Coemansia sp. RSA 1365]
MESAFGRLFRTSKLASYDSGINQVYTTYTRAMRRHEWGLKRTLPRKVMTRLATLKNIETKEQFIEFEDANQKYAMLQAWKENFPKSHSPGSVTAENTAHTLHTAYGQKNVKMGGRDGESQKDRGIPRSLANMTRAQWRRFIAEAHARRGEWKDELEKGNYAPEETLTFMNATAKASSSSIGVHRQPTYNDSQPLSETMEVQGRVLNRAGSVYAVAVQGIIARLPLQNYSLETRFNHRDINTFYVESATFDAMGRPDVTLGLRPHGARNTTIRSRSNDGDRFSAGMRSSQKSSIQDRYLDRIQNAAKLVDIVGRDGKNTSSAAKPDNKGDSKTASEADAKDSVPSKNFDPVSSVLANLRKTYK